MLIVYKRFTISAYLYLDIYLFDNVIYILEISLRLYGRDLFLESGCDHLRLFIVLVRTLVLVNELEGIDRISAETNLVNDCKNVKISPNN